MESTETSSVSTLFVDELERVPRERSAWTMTMEAALCLPPCAGRRCICLTSRIPLPVATPCPQQRESTLSSRVLWREASTEADGANKSILDISTGSMCRWLSGMPCTCSEQPGHARPAATTSVLRTAFWKKLHGYALPWVFQLGTSV